MTKLNVIQELKDLDGVVINSSRECAVVDQKGNLVKDRDGNELVTVIKSKNVLTLKKVCVESLLASFGQGEKDTGEDKAKRYILAMKIHEAKKDVDDLEAEDISLLKELIGNNYGPLVVGQAHMMLENKNEKKKSK